MVFQCANPRRNSPVLWGQLFCQKCGYEGSDFMWMWHHYMSFDVLLQDVQSLALRVLTIPDHETFYRHGTESEEVVKRRSEELVNELVTKEIKPTERAGPAV
jgi:hypothetical protein